MVELSREQEEFKRKYLAQLNGKINMNMGLSDKIKAYDLGIEVPQSDLRTRTEKIYDHNNQMQTLKKNLNELFGDDNISISNAVDYFKNDPNDTLFFNKNYKKIYNELDDNIDMDYLTFDYFEPFYERFKKVKNENLGLQTTAKEIADELQKSGNNTGDPNYEFLNKKINFKFFKNDKNYMGLFADKLYIKEELIYKLDSSQNIVDIKTTLINSINEVFKNVVSILDHATDEEYIDGKIPLFEKPLRIEFMDYSQAIQYATLVKDKVIEELINGDIEKEAIQLAEAERKRQEAEEAQRLADQQAEEARIKQEEENRRLGIVENIKNKTIEGKLKNVAGEKVKRLREKMQQKEEEKRQDEERQRQEEEQKRAEEARIKEEEDAKRKAIEDKYNEDMAYYQEQQQQEDEKYDKALQKYNEEMEGYDAYMKEVNKFKVTDTVEYDGDEYTFQGKQRPYFLSDDGKKVLFYKIHRSAKKRNLNLKATVKKYSKFDENDDLPQPPIGPPQKVTLTPPAKIGTGLRRKNKNLFPIYPNKKKKEVRPKINIEKALFNNVSPKEHSYKQYARKQDYNDVKQSSSGKLIKTKKPTKKVIDLLHKLGYKIN